MLPMKIIFQEYWRTLLRAKYAFALVVTALTATVIFDLGLPLIYKNIANGLTQSFSEASLSYLMTQLAYVAALHVAIWLSWRILEFGIIPLEAAGIRHLEQRCYKALLQQRYSFFENNFAGSLVKQANRFINAFETIVDWFLFQLLNNLLAIIIAFIIFFQQQPEFALYFLGWCVLFLGWSIGFSIWKLKYDERVAKWDSKLGGAYSDGISNISIVKSFALERQEQQHVNDIAQETYKHRRFSWVLMFISFAVQGFLSFAIELILIFLMIKKWESGQFDVGEFVLFQSIVLLLIHRLWDFGQRFRSFFGALADAREMAEILQITDLENDAAHAQIKPIQAGKIEYRHIYFNYNQGKQQQGLFQDFNLTIKAGEKVAFVGHSGSGKTSLTKLLFRFVEPQQGELLLDDQSATSFTLASLREQISLVPQQPELFHRSIRDNICLGRNISDTLLQEACRKAGALAFIEKLPDQFETEVGERGVKLSGGEKQRIAIARAFLDQSPIVVLDEATSALDSLTEQQIQRAIFELIENKTAIVIAHRLATILKMDRIIVLENGAIVEQGSHNELLQLQGRYYKMWQHQSGEFIGTDQAMES